MQLFQLLYIRVKVFRALVYNYKVSNLLVSCYNLLIAHNEFHGDCLGCTIIMCIKISIQPSLIMSHFHVKKRCNSLFYRTAKPCRYVSSPSPSPSSGPRASSARSGPSGSSSLFSSSSKCFS